MKNLAVVLLLPLILSGCFNSTEVDDMTYVMAVGVEKDAYIFQLALPLNISGDKEADAEQEDEAFSLYSVKIKEKDFDVAVDKLNNKISKSVALSHIGLFVFSKDIAKNGLDKFYNVLSDIEIRPSAYLTLADNPEEFLKSVSSPFELNPAKYYEMLYSGENRSFYESLSVHEFLSKETVLIPVSSSDGSEQGCAVLKNRKTVMMLRPDEVFYYRLLKGSLPLSHIKTGSGTYEIKSLCPTETKLKQSKANLKIHIEGNEKTRYKIYQGCMSLIEKTKKEGVDLLGIKNKSRKSFLTLEAFKHSDFDIRKTLFELETVFD